MSKTNYPIDHWSYSSLVTYLRNPLAWYKQYVEKVYDSPRSPASVIGQAGHHALENFYGGFSKEASIDLGLDFLRRIPDFEINFGRASSVAAIKKKRRKMENEYLRAINYYLIRAPRHEVLGVEVVANAEIPGVPIPVKAISDLVIQSKDDPEALDIVDHKFVASFNRYGKDNLLYTIQALFNYYTVLHEYQRPVRRFLIYECKKTKNKNSRQGQLRRHVINYLEYEDEMRVFQKLIKEATEDLKNRKKFLPNPSDMFDGRNSLDVYRMNL